MKRHLRESKMKVSELDFEPTLKAVEKIADRLGLKWDNVKQGTIEQRGDYTFTVKDIPNHGINQFSVHKSDDGQSLIVSVPDTAKMDVALEGKKPLTFAQTGYVKEAKRMQEIAGLSTETIGSSRAYLNPHRAADLIADEFGEELAALMKDVNGTLRSTPSFEKTALGYLRAKMDAKDYMSFRNDPDEPSDYISTLVQNLNSRGNDSDLYPGTMGDEMSAPTSI